MASMLKLPRFFSDGMVIGKKAKIWGWASPCEKVTASFCGKTLESVADAGGRFEFVLESENYGSGFELTVGDKIIKDVHVGRVWLCGGQSNMEGPIVRTRVLLDKYVVEDPRIHIFQVEKGHNFHNPVDDVNGKWNTATGDFLDDMYAVPYFFARKLLENLPDDVPIGLLCTPAGGTPLEGWLPEEIIKDFPYLHENLLPVKEPDFVEKATNEAEKNVQAWHSELATKDAGIAENWHDPEYDDSSWESQMLLDSTGLPEHGAVWLRRKITLPKIDGGAKLIFGRVENSVKIYVNGTQVVDIPYMYPPCTCNIPVGLLTKGLNTIAVRIVGDGNKLKLVPGRDYVLQYPGGSVDLSGLWKKRVGAEMPKSPVGAWFYNLPCGVYNHMLAPVLGYSVEGMIWYQGESNAGRPHDYSRLFGIFTDLIRKYFGQNLPIIFTQLANYIDPNGGPWEELREQQRKCLKIPNTAMAVAIDCGEWNDLHPSDKKTVGDRLALHALRMVYGKKIVSDGPTVTKAECKNGVLTVHFNNAAGMYATNGRPILDIQDEAGEIRKIYANVKEETLQASIGAITPVLVRFGWADCPAVALYNAYGLPASPFEVPIN